MLRLTSLANQYTRRTLRPLYAQTQAYPYDVQLDPTFDRGVMFDSSTPAVAASKAAILPGLVATKLVGEVVSLSTAGSATPRAFGLFANFVGGELSDIPSDFDRVGVWRGVGGVFEILAPVFSDNNSLSTLAAGENTDAAADGGEEVYMLPNAKGQLEASGAEAYDFAEGSPVARLIKYLSANAIIVELLV
jgi:hypothetical protein